MNSEALPGDQKFSLATVDLDYCGNSISMSIHQNAAVVRTLWNGTRTVAIASARATSIHQNAVVVDFRSTNEQISADLQSSSRVHQPQTNTVEPFEPDKRTDICGPFLSF